jgi:hypothetical protein
MRATIVRTNIAVEILPLAMQNQMPIEITSSEKLTLAHRESDFFSVLYNLFLDLKTHRIIKS